MQFINVSCEECEEGNISGYHSREDYCTVRVKELYLKATLNLIHYLIPQRDSKDLMEIHLYRKKSRNCK